MSSNIYDLISELENLTNSAAAIAEQAKIIRDRLIELQRQVYQIGEGRDDNEPKKNHDSGES